MEKKKTNYLSESIIFFIIWNAIFYFTISFYYLDINFQNWSGFSRILFCLLGVSFGIMVSSRYYFGNLEKED